jgi:hypothetical protein
LHISTTVVKIKMTRTMKRKLILIFLILCLLPGISIYSQDKKSKQDSTKTASDGKSGKAGGNNGKGANGKCVKQVRGARPNMMRARGARPPEITRPSGSAIPRGMGTPAGAGRRGGR